MTIYWKALLGHGPSVKNVKSRLTNLRAMGKQLFLGNMGVLISKINFSRLYSCTLPQKQDPFRA
jgi:hypothetical protein